MTMSEYEKYGIYIGSPYGDLSRKISKLIQSYVLEHDLNKRKQIMKELDVLREQRTAMLSMRKRK